MPETPPRAIVVDYGLGNLFSVRQALERVGMAALVTGDPAKLAEADAVVLPGVGAFGDAMASLARLGFADPLRRWAAEDKPLLGVCLGMQLLMEESFEFGRHAGLGIFRGRVVKFDAPRDARGALKVPQVGWNRLRPPTDGAAASWRGTPLDGLEDGVWMYFVHSYHVVPEEAALVLSFSDYGSVRFCSSIRRGNVFACQYHPERSGLAGLSLYRRFAALVRDARKRSGHADGHPSQV